MTYEELRVFFSKEDTRFKQAQVQQPFSTGGFYFDNAPRDCTEEVRALLKEADQMRDEIAMLKDVNSMCEGRESLAVMREFEGEVQVARLEALLKEQKRQNARAAAEAQGWKQRYAMLCDCVRSLAAANIEAFEVLARESRAAQEGDTEGQNDATR